jgi:hypothetical protein
MTSDIHLQEQASQPRPGAGQRTVRRLAALLPLVAALGFSAPAQAGLVLSAVYEDAATAAAHGNQVIDSASRAIIDSALAEYSTLFSDNFSFRINIVGVATGLGYSSQFAFHTGYSSFRSALVGDAKTSDDATAIANSAPGSNPLGGGNILLTRAQSIALGLGDPNAGSTAFGAADIFGTIGLNMDLMNLRGSAFDPAKYDLYAVLQHEANEFFGTSSNAPNSFGDSSAPTRFRAIDLMRFASPGTLAYASSMCDAGQTAYFSIDGGATNLGGFNTDCGADTGDLDSATPRTQNAYGTPGLQIDSMSATGVELMMLDVTGLDRIPRVVPEPGGLALALTALGIAGGLARRRKH